MRSTRMIISVFFVFHAGFLAAQKAIPAEIFPNILEAALANGVEMEEIEKSVVSDDYVSNGIRHIYLQQQLEGIPVFNGILNIAIFDDNKYFIAGTRFVALANRKIKSGVLSLSAESAVLNAAGHLGVALRTPLQRLTSTVFDEKENRFQSVLFTDGGISRDPIPASLTWQLDESGILELAWNIRIHEIDTENWWEIRISATDGSFLDQNNWTVHCTWPTDDIDIAAYSPDKDQLTAVPVGNLPFFFGANDYHVYDLPIESPDHGSRTIVNSPWDRPGAGDPAATLQWHNDGLTDYTTTRGNNVYAYEDQDGDNNTIGNSPSSGSLDFNFPVDLSMPPGTYQDASLTNLFYWNNTCHDVFYAYGFDEVSGNFQNDNLVRGGLGNDYVQAQGQDGDGINNANFSTPPDGLNGRMQMYLWSSTERSVTANPIGTTTTVGIANFGPTSFNLTADLVLVNDGVGTITDGCQTFGGVAGKIALIDRNASCNFVTKVLNAQAAGAVGVIIINNVAGVINLNGSDPTVTTPALMITETDGTALKNALINGPVSLTVIRSLLEKDGSFDNGIIAHEYGHGVSTRLTGGPSISSCLNNKEQMGEGWSDYFALMMTTNWATANKNDLRPIATFAKNQPVNGAGVRDYPYSYDMTASPYDYDYSRTNSSPYGNGSTWCAMLWDMTWEIIELVPASTDMYDGTGGNNIALALVMEAMKLQPCNPGLEDGRDAILLADKMLYGGTYRCAIWKAFARRGLGKLADQGSPFTQMDGNSNFMVPEVIFHLANIPAANIETPVTFTLETDNVCNNHNALEIVVTLQVGLDYLSGGSYNNGTREITFSPFALAPNQSTTLTFQAKITTPVTAPVFLFNDDAEDIVKWSAVGDFVISGLHNSSPANAWRAQEATMPTVSTLTMNTPLLLPATGTLSLLFWHQGMIEPTFDGGVVEISTDGGGAWTDLGSLMTENGYTTGLADTDNAAFTTGTPVFTGIYNGRITKINLTSYAGQSILIRFRFGTDTGNANAFFEGWFIDDILVVQADIPIFTVNADISAFGNLLCNTTSNIRAIYDTAFPIELLSFNARVFGEKKVSLDWQTATETNNDFFSVERSQDATLFESIGTVKGAGNSSQPQEYALIDRLPLNGISYYRLKQTDFNGVSTYSPVRVVNFLEDDYFNAYPNPADDVIQVIYTAKGSGATITLYNMLGQPLRQLAVKERGNISLDLSDLPIGLYILELRGEDSSLELKIEKR